MPFALVWLPGGHWQFASVVAAGALTLALGTVALAAPWDRLPGAAPCLLAFAYLGVIGLLRDSGGPSGVAPLALLPVFWLGLCGNRRQLWAMLVGVAITILLPLVVSSGNGYPASSWRAAILLIAVSGLVGTTIQALVARVREQDSERGRLLRQLDHLAHTDMLTGLPNRRSWEAGLESWLARARDTGSPLTVALIDIDSFKTVNDVHGHPAGDSLLTELAQNWSDELRADDLLARIGGDEFGLLLPRCSEREATAVVARLRERVPFPHSCSVGLAGWDELESADALVQRADQALYEVKRERDCQGPAAALASE